MPGNDKWKIFAAYAVIYVVWGSTYFGILIALDDIPPFLMCAIRFFISGVLLYGWCLVKRQPAPSVQSIIKNVPPAILLLFGGTASVTWAEQYLPSSLAAIIVTALPFWFVLLDKQQWSFYFSNRIIIIGLLVGFAGVLMLIGFQHPAHKPNVTTGQQISGVLAIIVGGICWAAGSLFSKYRPASEGLLMNAGLQMLMASVFTTIVAVISGDLDGFSFAAVSGKVWFAVFYLAIVSSIIAYLSYLYLLKVRPAAMVSTYVYVNPIIALLLGAIFVNEKITLLQVVALLIILVGVLLVNLPRYKPAFFSKRVKQSA